jgi:hypothetical protein
MVSSATNSITKWLLCARSERDGRDQTDEDRAQQEEDPQELSVPGVVQEAVEGLGADIGRVETEEQADQQGQLANDGNRRDALVQGLGQHDLEDEQSQGQQAEGDLGENGTPLVGIGGGLKKFKVHGGGAYLATSVDGNAPAAGQAGCMA